MSFTVLKDLQSFLIHHFNAESACPQNWKIEAELCPAEMKGELTVNCFRFARYFKQSPDMLASIVVDFLKKHEDVESVDQIKAFVNLTLKNVAVFRDGLANMDSLWAECVLAEKDRQRILIEFSAPNTNKPQHLGHVRNNTIGMSLASLLSRVKHDVIPVNLVNDRGIHICKSMIAYQKFGNGMTPETEKIKGDHFVGNFYVRYNQALSEEMKALRSHHPEWQDKSDDDLFLETEIGKETQKMLQSWESGDEKTRSLWKLMNSWVLAGFEQTYQRMGIKFAKTYYESNTYLLGKDLVSQGLQKGVFSKRPDGATTISLGKLGDKVVLRSDGTSVYMTQDLGTTLLKEQEWNAQRQIWVVGDEQIHHFKQLFEILKRLGYEWAEGLYHLSYGMVNLPSGKMKSREGTVVDADDLFDEMAKLAKERILENCHDNPPADLEQRAEMIGMGALKFMLLKFNAKTTIMFDPQASVRFEGDTGPYLQYACARIQSIERKAAERQMSTAEVDWSLLQAKEEKAVAIRAMFYPAALLNAADKMDCSPLADYLLSLAKEFSRFYRECPVLHPDTPMPLAQARLALCSQVRKILQDGLTTMTISIPDSM